MKLKTLVATALIALTCAAQSADQHGHDHKPLHGGVVAEAGHLELELVAEPSQIRLFVRDHGKPANLQGASAKLTLLTGSEKTELALSPVGDSLMAKGSFKLGAGSKAVALLTLTGRKPVNVRFALK